MCVSSIYIYKNTSTVLTVLPALPASQDLPSDVSLAVQECLSSMALAYHGVKGQNALLLEALLLENIYSVSVY